MKFSFILFLVYVAISKTHENPDSATPKKQKEASPLEHTTMAYSSKSDQKSTTQELLAISGKNNKIANQESNTESANKNQNDKESPSPINFYKFELKDPDPYENIRENEIKHYEEIYKKNFRRYGIDKIRCTAYESTHCIALIWPVLDGIIDIEKDDYVTYSMKDHDVLRLMNLMVVNTTTFEHQDLYALMYQISKIPIRLFHWEIEPLKALLYFLDHRKEHTFTSVKHGLQLLLETWRVSYTHNITYFADTAHIIRPPCLYPEKMKGSTIGQYKKSTRKPNTFTKKKCHSRKPGDLREDDEDCEP